MADSAADGPSSVEILAAIMTCKEALKAKTNFLAADISLIFHDLDKFCSHLIAAESDTTDLHALQLQVRALQGKVIDTENCLCHNNIRILLLERAEGSRPAEFVETFLANLLDLTANFVVEWAHRVPLLHLFLVHLCSLFCSSCSFTRIESGSWW